MLGVLRTIRGASLSPTVQTWFANASDELQSISEVFTQCIGENSCIPDQHELTSLFDPISFMTPLAHDAIMNTVIVENEHQELQNVNTSDSGHHDYVCRLDNTISVENRNSNCTHEPFKENVIQSDVTDDKINDHAASQCTVIQTSITSLN